MNVFKLNFTDYFFQVWNISISEFYPYRDGFFLIDTNGNNYFLKTSNEDPKEMDRYINYFNKLKSYFHNACDLTKIINGRISYNNFYLLSFPKGVKVELSQKTLKEELINTFKRYFNVCNECPISFLKENDFLDDFLKNKSLLEDKHFEISGKIFKNNIEEIFIRNYYKLHDLINKNIEDLTNVYTELSVNSYPRYIQYFDIENMYLSYSNGEIYFVDFSIPKNELRAISYLKIIKRFNWDINDFIDRMKPKIFKLEIDFIKLYLSLPHEFMNKYLKYFNGAYINEADFDRISVEV